MKRSDAAEQAAAPACTPGSARQGGGRMLSTGPGPQRLRLSLAAASPAASSLGRNRALLAVQATGCAEAPAQPQSYSLLGTPTAQEAELRPQSWVQNQM